ILPSSAPSRHYTLSLHDALPIFPSNRMPAETLGNNSLLHRPWQAPTVACKVGRKLRRCRRIGQHFRVAFAYRGFFRLHLRHGLSGALSFERQRCLPRFFFQSALFCDFPLDSISDGSRQSFVFLLLLTQLLLEFLLLLGKRLQYFGLS